ncbi:MAG: DUF4407 domain-containing protein [Chitinophagales bacterium]|nr:DUF4407 domain-containing protein [Chitinophagales bacterium]
MTIKDFFLILSGDDRSIIRECSKKTQNRFVLIGALVACIIAISFISVTGAFIHFFDFVLFDIAIGIFFALMMANIYILLLYTLSKNLLPHISSRGARWISIALRVVFIAVFAMIVSKPFELMLFSPFLKSDIELHKAKEYKVNETVVNSLYEKSFNELERMIQLGDNSVKSILLKKQIEKTNILALLKQKIYSSDCYIEQIRILNSKYIFTWIVTIMMIMLFVAPVYLKYLMEEQNEFYQKKKKIETQIVLDEYASFKARYKAFWKEFFQDLEVRPPDKHERMNVVLAEITQKNYEFEVVFADPPFNTIRKKDARDFLEQSSLKEELYDV